MNDRELFWALLLGYLAVFLLLWPATYAIDDECNILSLAVALTRGTVFLDRAHVSLDADLVWHGHSISKFSPFHAALLVPAIETSWRLAFAVSPLFVISGAFIFKRMLERERLSTAWVGLYFFNPALLYYSRTLLAMVPASVLALWGASLLFRRNPRPILAGLALGAAALLHVWLVPIAALLALGWWVECRDKGSLSAAYLALGLLPAVLAESAYNFLVTGSPIRSAYWIIGHQYAFDGQHVWAFATFYIGTLAVVPLGGWAVLTRRWSGNWTLPLTSVVVLLAASLYYYRDGLQYGLAGWVPGQRFLLPVSLLACLPAARFLSHAFSAARLSSFQRNLVSAAVFVAFVAGFSGVSLLHQDYLGAQGKLQSAIRTSIPDGASVASIDSAFKAFAPVNGRWVLRLARYGTAPTHAQREGAYIVWIGGPGERPPAGWFEGRQPKAIPLRSWVWNRDLWIAPPEQDVTV